MTFNESNSVEAYLRDLLCGGVTHHTAAGPGLARRNRQVSGLGWHYLAPWRSQQAIGVTASTMTSPAAS